MPPATHGKCCRNVRVVLGLSADLLCTIAVEEDWDVADLKWEVARVSGMPGGEQRYVLKGRVLGNTEMLASLFPEKSKSVPAEVTLVRLDPKFAQLVNDIQTGQVRVKNINEEFRDDRDLALVAVRRDVGCLQYLSQKLRGDREVVLSALQAHPRSLEHASPELRADKDVVLLAVAQDGLAIQYADQQLQVDIDIASAAVKRNGFAFEFLSPELKRRRDLAILAMKDQGEAFQYLPHDMKNDKELVLLACSSNSEALRWVPPALLEDDEVIAAAGRGIRLRGHGRAPAYFKALLQDVRSGRCQQSNSYAERHNIKS